MMSIMKDAHDPSTSARDMFARTLTLSLARMALELEEWQHARLWEHFRCVVEANRSFNLTRITEPVEAAVKHYADSLSLLTLDVLDRCRGLEVLDVGTGAGFPGVPLAIACPAWRITAIDGTGKKARFVAEMADHLGLKNLQAVQSRASTQSRSRPGAFDLICLRAVTSLDQGLGEVHRLVRSGGWIVFYKVAGMSPEERNAGDRAAVQQGLTVGQAHEIIVSGLSEDLHRVLMVYERRNKRSKS